MLFICQQKLKFILILVSLTIITSYLNAQGYITPKGCLNCPPHPTKEKIEVSFYYEKGDLECLRTQKLLEILSASSGNISLQMRDISLPNNKELFDMLFGIYHKGLNRDKKVPAIFFENKLFIGYKEIYDNFYLPIITEIEEKSSENIKGKISKFLRKVKIYTINSSGNLLGATIIIAGLIDGINPCAISILIFLIFSLSRLRSRRNQTLALGVSFIFGVFISYLVIGLGLLKLIISPLFASVYNWIFTSMGVLAFIIGGFSILDFYYARERNTRRIKLQLPLRYKRLSHSVIRNTSITNLFIVFWIGVLMSFIEFPCSGQVYLPTVTLIGNPINSVKPFFLLFLYNFMFILPLIAIVVLSTLWLSSEKISTFVSKNLALTKLLT
ncbi:hypothetical protein H5T89_12140, partial [bacterium]|nr:hypothetical protein [bacterium]